MSLPHVLLVDDSEAVLAFERAVLAGHYAISTAVNGAEALEEMRRLSPALVLLDISMPVMDGDEVLLRAKADPNLRDVPIVVVSSEKARGEACLHAGAAAFALKPIRAEELLALVHRVLDAARAERARGSLAVLFIEVGPAELGLPLACVRTVASQVATFRVPTAPPFLAEAFELRGAPVCVLDLALRLGVEHRVSLLERKLVVVAHEGLLLALCVDHVRDPEELPASDLVPRADVGGAEFAPLREALLALARTSRGFRLVLDPRALFSPRLARRIPPLVDRVMNRAVEVP